MIKEHRTGSLSSRAGGSQPGGGRGCLTDSPLRAEFSRPRRKWHRCPRWQCHVQPLCTQPTATILDSDVTSEEKGSRGIRRVLLKGGTLVCEASARDPYKQVKWTKFKGGKKELDFITQILFLLPENCEQVLPTIQECHYLHLR